MSYSLKNIILNIICDIFNPMIQLQEWAVIFSKYHIPYTFLNQFFFCIGINLQYMSYIGFCKFFDFFYVSLAFCISLEEREKERKKPDRAKNKQIFVIFKF